MARISVVPILLLPFAPMLTSLLAARHSNKGMVTVRVADHDVLTSETFKDVSRAQGQAAEAFMDVAKPQEMLVPSTVSLLPGRAPIPQVNVKPINFPYYNLKHHWSPGVLVGPHLKPGPLFAEAQNSDGDDKGHDKGDWELAALDSNNLASFALPENLPFINGLEAFEWRRLNATDKLIMSSKPVLERLQIADRNLQDQISQLSPTWTPPELEPLSALDAGAALQGSLSVTQETEDALENVVKLDTGLRSIQSLLVEVSRLGSMLSASSAISHKETLALAARVDLDLQSPITSFNSVGILPSDLEPMTADENGTKAEDQRSAVDWFREVRELESSLRIALQRAELELARVNQLGSGSNPSDAL